jgi:hypothetical protein
MDVEVEPPELVAIIVNEVVSNAVRGVPEITPVDVSKDRPLGKDKDGLIDQDTTVPPLTEGDKLAISVSLTSIKSDIS